MDLIGGRGGGLGHIILGKYVEYWWGLKLVLLELPKWWVKMPFFILFLLPWGV